MPQTVVRFRLLGVVLCLLIIGSAVLLRRPPVAQAASKTPSFGREVIVDHQRGIGETSISMDSQDRVYVSAPFGFSTTASYVWRSTDHGQSFHLVPGNISATFGKPITCVGGGDTGFAVRTV